MAAAGGGEGRWKERREVETEKEGGEARQRGPAYTGSEWRELENESGERESLPSVWLSRREVRISRTRPDCPPGLHPEQQQREEEKTG